MLALLGYPFLIEPWLTNREQSVAWSAAYGAFALACAGLAWRSRALAPIGEDSGHTAAEAAEPSPRAGAIALWLALSAMGVVMLLAVTNHLTQNIPSVPLLRVMPLAIYLLTRSEER